MVEDRDGAVAEAGKGRQEPPRSVPVRRVLQILHSPDPGGVLALARSIADGLAPHGIGIETIFLAPGPNLSILTKLKGALAAVRRILGGGHETVIAYQAGPSIVVGLAGLLARGKRIIVHQTTVPSATKAPVRWMGGLLGWLGLFPVNIVNTAFTRGEFDGYARAYRKRLKLIEHGVERPLVTRARADTLRRHAIPDDRHVLLNTARLSEEKNQAVLIRALPALPDCRLVIAGEGDRRHELAALARSLGVEDRLHLLGALPRDEAVQLYGAADLFLFPSLHETFGISAVEAVMLAVPSIVSDIPVLREVLTVEGRSPASFVPPAEVAAWAGQIRRWCDRPPPRADLAAFADLLAERYSERRMIDAYVELLTQPIR